MNLSLVNELSGSVQVLSGLQTVTSTNLSQEYEFLANNEMVDTRFIELRAALEWSGGVPVETDAPIVRSIEVEFEEVSINI
jgi:hypothetical protein